MSENENLPEAHDIVTSEHSDEAVEAVDEPGDESKKASSKKTKKAEEPRKTLLTAPDGPVGTDTGLLSLIGNPVGRVLNVALSPIGYVTGAIGHPHGEALLAVQRRAKEEIGYKKDDDTGKDGARSDRIGGNEQNGQNPLGL